MYSTHSSDRAPTSKSECCKSIPSVPAVSSTTPSSTSVHRLFISRGPEMPANTETTGTRRRARGASNPREAPSQPTHASSAAQNQNEAAPRQPPTVQAALKQVVLRALLMYAIYYYYVKPKKEADQAKVIDTATTPTTLPAPPQPQNPLAALLGTSTGPVPAYYSLKLHSAWDHNTPFQLRVFTSLNSDMTFRDALRTSSADLIWSVDGLDFSTAAKNYLSVNVTLPVPYAVREKNATWYAHTFVARKRLFDTPPESISGEMIESHTLHARHQFVTWLKVDLKKEGKSLLGEADTKEDTPSNPSAVHQEQSTSDRMSVQEKDPTPAHDSDDTPRFRFDQVWKPTLPIFLVIAKGELLLNQLPPPASEQFRVSEESRMYYPPLEVNEFWTLREYMALMNETVHDIKVEVSLTPMSLYKWALYKQFDNVWKRQIDLGVMRPEETDDLKRMFIETNPLLLGTTMVVSLAHTVLETLAFKNDISHWKSIKSMEGVSVRSMVWKIVMEAIIFLYLWDNETSWMITIGNGVGLAIAIWKLGKAVKFENFGKKKLLGFIPWFEVSDRESYSKETKEYDEIAMRYLGYVLYPLVICYALYSLKYQRHKSWYSWVINSLVGAVYAFGFIMMFPQIFINYKLKSVAHMPMKAMMYKTLNTIIDDLFSFIIKMPWLHRLACFRDDVVFLIILYQRWIYPVDKSRVNEFGQQFEENGEEKTDKDGPEQQEGEGTAEIAEKPKPKSKEAGEGTEDSVASEATDTNPSKPDGEKKND